MSESIKIHALRCGEILVDKAVPFGNVSKNHGLIPAFSSQSGTRFGCLFSRT